MSNLVNYQKCLEKLSDNPDAINFILDEIQKMSQFDKIRSIAEMIFIKNIMGLKHKLPEDEYQEQLQIVNRLISPLKIIVDVELKGNTPTQIQSNNWIGELRNIILAQQQLLTSPTITQTSNQQQLLEQTEVISEPQQLLNQAEISEQTEKTSAQEKLSDLSESRNTQALVDNFKFWNS